MSGLTKLYASRALEGRTGGSEEKLAPRVEISNPFGDAASVRRRIDAAREFSSARSFPTDADTDKKEDFVNNYGAALGMLENVNAGFADVYNRLQEAERNKEHLLGELDKHNQLIQQMQYDLEMSKRQCEDSEKEAAEIADRLIAETARATNLEHSNGQMEQALHESRNRVTELEEICKTLHDGIFSIFGVGSPTQKVLSELGRKHI